MHMKMFIIFAILTSLFITKSYANSEGVDELNEEQIHNMPPLALPSPNKMSDYNTCSKIHELIYKHDFHYYKEVAHYRCSKLSSKGKLENLNRFFEDKKFESCVKIQSQAYIGAEFNKTTIVNQKCFQEFQDQNLALYEIMNKRQEYNQCVKKEYNEMPNYYTSNASAHQKCIENFKQKKWDYLKLEFTDLQKEVNKIVEKKKRNDRNKIVDSSFRSLKKSQEFSVNTLIHNRSEKK